MKTSPQIIDADTITMPETALATPRDVSPMGLIEQAVAKGVQPEQLSKLMDLQERWERSRAAESFSQALAKFQRGCPQIHKGRKGGHGNYASYDDIMHVIRPLLADCGLSVSFDSKHVDGGKVIACTCIVKHGIHEHRTEFTCPTPTDMKANASQQYGAALTYVKRYALCAALNIVVTDEDTDGDGIDNTPITPEQAITIEDCLESCGAKRDLFLQWVSKAANRDLADVRDIPANLYEKVMAELRKKMNQRGAK